jgi:hypothetical protein
MIFIFSSLAFSDAILYDEAAERRALLSAKQNLLPISIETTSYHHLTASY